MPDIGVASLSFCGKEILILAGVHRTIIPAATGT